MCVVCIKKKPPHNRVRACPSMTSPSCIPHDVCLRCSNSLFLLWNLAPQRTHVTRVTSVAFNIACFRNNSTLGSLATQAKHRAASRTCRKRDNRNSAKAKHTPNQRPKIKLAKYHE